MSSHCSVPVGPNVAGVQMFCGVRARYDCSHFTEPCIANVAQRYPAPPSSSYAVCPTDRRANATVSRYAYVGWLNVPVNARNGPVLVMLVVYEACTRAEFTSPS